MKFFSAEARKAQIAALVGFLGPILTYLQTETEWSWRAFAGAVVSGVVAGLTVYNIKNAEPRESRRLRNRRRAQEG